MYIKKYRIKIEKYIREGFDSAAGKIKHYRVDKMRDTQLTKKPREGTEDRRSGTRETGIPGISEKHCGCVLIYDNLRFLIICGKHGLLSLHHQEEHKSSSKEKEIERDKKENKTMMNRLMKKVAVAIAAATMTIAATASIASANETKYVANEIGVNVRQSASADAKRLGGLYQGDAVDAVYDLGNGWTKINFNGKEAYVVSDCLSYSKPAVKTASSTHDADQSWITFTNSSNTTREQQARGYMSHDNNTFTASVDSGYLALRSTAYSSSDNIIGEIQKGQMVQVQEFGSQFDYVYVPALDMYGYVNNDYLDA